MQFLIPNPFKIPSVTHPTPGIFQILNSSIIFVIASPSKGTLKVPFGLFISLQIFASILFGPTPAEHVSFVASFIFILISSAT